MGRPLQLESFDPPDAGGQLNLFFPEARLEEERLQAFDKGYRAGWDDSAAAHAEEQGRISAEFAGNLQDMSFTYHEARAAMLSEMEGILKGMVDKILPGTLRHSLGDMILQQVSDLSAGAADVRVEIVVSPGNGDLLRNLIAGQVGPPMEIVEEESLGDGQAFLRMGRVERKLDIDSVLDDISDAVASFFEQGETMEFAHA